MPRIKKAHMLLLVILYGTMFLFGFLENIKGVSFPLIKNEFNVSYKTQGQMISLLSFCYTFFVAASGFLLARFGAKKVYLLGLILALAGVLTIYFMPGFWAAGFSLLLVFAGFGILEIGVNGAATRIFTKKAALMMSLLHFMYGFGAIVSPKAAGFLTGPSGPGLGWRHIYLLTVPLVLLVFLPALFTKFPGSPGFEDTGESVEPSADVSPAGSAQTIGFIAALKKPLVWFFGITLGLMIGIEMASPNWGGLYFQDMYGMDPTTMGANFVSAFFLLFTLSRLLSGFIIEKLGYMRSLTGAALITAAVFVTGFVLGEKGIYVLPALGFFIAIFWPTLMAVAMGCFGNSAPVITSAVIAIGGLLNAGIQFFIGYINRWGAFWGYRSCFVFAVILFFMLLGLSRAVKGRA